MTYDETKQLMALIRSIFPNFYKGVDADTIKAATSLWASCLDDIDGKHAMQGLVDYARENKFPPSVAEIREFARHHDPKDSLIAMAVKRSQRIKNDKQRAIQNETGAVK